jgi:hypothetical protein
MVCLSNMFLKKKVIRGKFSQKSDQYFLAVTQRRQKGEKLKRMCSSGQTGADRQTNIQLGQDINDDGRM